MKYLISFCFIFYLIPFSFAQKEISLHFLQGVEQANITNPSLVSSDKRVILLPSIYCNLYTPDFTLKNLFSVNAQGVRDLNELADSKLGNRNRLAGNLSFTTFGYAKTVLPKWRLTVLHSYSANIDADIDGVLVKALMNDYKNSIGKTFPFYAKVNGTIYHQLAFGASYQYQENLRLGARLKILKGISNVFTRKGESSVTINGNNYAASFNNNIAILTHNIDDLGEVRKINGLLKQSLNLRNLGIGLDIGATYTWKNWQFSASIVDAMSVINWRKDGRDYNGSGLRNFGGLNRSFTITLGSKAKSFNLQDTLKNIFGIDILENSKYLQKLPTKIYLSALYNLNNKLQLGALLYDERDKNFLNKTDFMLSASYKMLDNLTFGSSWSIRNKRFDNFGLHLLAQYKTTQIYATTDNIFTVFDPYNHKSANGRIGVNLIFN
jgi:hypothetical protein